jgi:hypothetical protein
MLDTQWGAEKVPVFKSCVVCEIDNEQVSTKKDIIAMLIHSLKRRDKWLRFKITEVRGLV